MRYGVQFQPQSGTIEAGTVRKSGDRELFITRCDVTGQVLGAAALWLLAHHDPALPYQITDRAGNTYELSARLVPAGQQIGIDDAE